MLGPSQRMEKTLEHEGNGDTNCSWCIWNSPKMFRKKNRGLVNQRKNEDHPGHSITNLIRILTKVLETLGDLLSLRFQ